jgi:hypothetical protein
MHTKVNDQTVSGSINTCLVSDSVEGWCAAGSLGVSNMFSVFIIILYNKNKVFLFHFCIFVYLDASLKFGERRHTSFFFK